MSRRRALFVADSASQLKPAHRMARRFEKAGWEIIGNLVPSRSGPTRRQVVDSGLKCPITSYSLEKLINDGALLSFDAVICMLPGTGLHSFLAHVSRAVTLAAPDKRPILVTGYNGVVYERHLEGLLWRQGYDVICVNSRADLDLFRNELESLGGDPGSLVVTGPVMAQNGVPEAGFPASPSQHVLFATQAVVPRVKAERSHVLHRLKAYAETYPERRVYIKPRTLPGEQTFHVEKYHYAVLYDELYGRSRPDNLLFGYAPLASYLSRVGLIITVSSTAVMEGLAHGVRGAVLTDFGIKESLGNHFFRRSGMLTTLDELIEDRVPEPSIEWLRQNGFHGDDSLASMVHRVEQLLGEQESRGTALPLPEPFYTADRAPYIYERSLPLKERKVDLPGPLATTYRKARKLVRSPRRFFEDARFRRRW